MRNIMTVIPVVIQTLYFICSSVKDTVNGLGYKHPVNVQLLLFYPLQVFHTSSNW